MSCYVYLVYVGKCSHLRSYVLTLVLDTLRAPFRVKWHKSGVLLDSILKGLLMNFPDSRTIYWKNKKVGAFSGKMTIIYYCMYKQVPRDKRYIKYVDWTFLCSRIIFTNLSHHPSELLCFYLLIKKKQTLKH